MKIKNLLKEKIKGWFHLFAIVALAIEGLITIWSGSILAENGYDLARFFGSGFISLLLTILIFWYGFIPAVITAAIFSLDFVFYFLGIYNSLSFPKIIIQLLLLLAIYDLWKTKRGKNKFLR